MSGQSMLFLVDGNPQRRNAICRALGERRVYVEPFENLRELHDYSPRDGVIAIADEPGALFELLAKMAATGQWLPVMAFAERPTSRSVARAIRQGAATYATWPCDAGELIDAMDEARAHNETLAGLHARSARARSKLGRLTRRERQVLDAIAEGLSNRAIGERLAISARTVEIHRSNMIAKVGAHHTSEAIKVAIEASLTEPPQS